MKVCLFRAVLIEKYMVFRLFKIVSAVVLVMVSLNVSGQDLLARQAPIDRKLKVVDSIALLRQIKAEMAEYPAYGLYPEWSNAYAHTYKNVTIPDSFRIDLSEFCMPTTHTKITSKFGPRRRRMHNGIDVKVYIGDTIRSAFAGKVRIVKNEGRRKGYGKYIIIRHDNGLETVYGHLSKQLVNENDDILFEFGAALGKVIYIMDACVDVKKDIKKCRYNPMVEIRRENFQQILTILLSDCTAIYDKMNITKNKAIIENVLFSGIWQVFRRSFK